MRIMFLDTSFCTRGLPYLSVLLLLAVSCTKVWSVVRVLTDLYHCLCQNWTQSKCSSLIQKSSFQLHSYISGGCHGKNTVSVRWQNLTKFTEINVKVMAVLITILQTSENHLSYYIWISLWLGLLLVLVSFSLSFRVSIRLSAI